MNPVCCPLCGKVSEPFVALEDYYFGSPGFWSYQRCSVESCGVAFPFPSPTDEQLAIAYSTYYTHDDSAGTSLPGVIEAGLAGLARGSVDAIRHLPIIGWFAEQIGWELGGLKPRNGLIVDIGAGDGGRLNRLKRAGWTRVIGIEPDPEAVRVAKANSIDVRLGSAESVPIADDTADAVVMHHVIEHVRGPRQAFAEAYRILKSDGELSVVTPNLDSAGRLRWGKFWRGFEAPRHLTIFTLEALGALAEGAGFEIVCGRTSARSAAWVDEISEQAAGIGSRSPGRFARLRRANRAFRAQASAVGVERGEELVLIARKPRG